MELSDLGGRERLKGEESLFGEISETPVKGGDTGRFCDMIGLSRTAYKKRFVLINIEVIKLNAQSK